MVLLELGQAMWTQGTHAADALAAAAYRRKVPS